jgi:hypothetical protein
MSAWPDKDDHQQLDDSEKSFEDNFVSSSIKQFVKLDDSDEYLSKLSNLFFIYLQSIYLCYLRIKFKIISASRLNKIKKNSNILQQLKEKREEHINNLLNNSTGTGINCDKDLQLEEAIEPNKVISYLIPQQAQNVGEVANLIKHDYLDLQNEEIKAEEEQQQKIEQEETEKKCDN